jgi:eukaryotic-like serine/threonine-protein kinase
MAAVAADSELLFGLLALQNGLINQAQLVAAFQAWTLERSKSLADHLVVLGHLSPARRPVVEAMEALHLEAHDGDVGKSLAAVPASRATAPDWPRSRSHTSRPPWHASGGHKPRTSR